MKVEKTLNKYRSRTAVVKVKSSAVCSPIVVHKDFVFTDDHKMRIAEVSRENIQDLINAAAEDSGLKAVLSRILKDNDVGEFNNLALQNEQIVDIRAQQKVDVNELMKPTQTVYDNADKLSQLFGIKRDDLLKLSNDDLVKFIKEASVKLEKKEGNKDE